MAFKNGLPTWVSALYLPGHSARPSAAPLGCRPDAVVLDLEDFVPHDAKADARAALPRTAAGFRAHGIDVAVRINRPLEQALADLDRAVGPDVQALMLTKLAGADHVRLLDEHVATLESRRGLPVGGIRFVGMIETASGLSQIAEIAGACDRMAAITLGGEDLARECRMQSSEATLMHAKQSLVLAAAAAGIVPWGLLASVVDFADERSFAQMANRSRDFGFRASTCQRAAQVEMVNRIYAPTDTEVARASHTVALAAGSDGWQLDRGEVAHAYWVCATQERHAQRPALHTVA